MQGIHERIIKIEFFLCAEKDLEKIIAMLLPQQVMDFSVGKAG
jgi:hypothetical protein